MGISFKQYYYKNTPIFESDDISVQAPQSGYKSREGEFYELISKVGGLIRINFPMWRTYFDNTKIFRCIPSATEEVSSTSKPSNVETLVHPQQYEKTMAVDAQGNIFISEKFALELPLKEAFGVVCHEILHVVMLHFQRFNASRNMQVWNYATDYIINWELRNLGVSLPDGCLMAQEKTGDITIKHCDIGPGLGKQVNLLNENGKVRSAEEMYSILIRAELDKCLKPPAQQGEPQVGDIIRCDDQTSPNFNKYGKITSIDDKTGELTIDELSKDEARKLVKQQGQNPFSESFLLSEAFTAMPEQVRTMMPPPPKGNSSSSDQPPGPQPHRPEPIDSPEPSDGDGDDGEGGGEGEGDVTADTHTTETTSQTPSDGKPGFDEHIYDDTLVQKAKEQGKEPSVKSRSDWGQIEQTARVQNPQNNVGDGAGGKYGMGKGEAVADWQQILRNHVNNLAKPTKSYRRLSRRSYAAKIPFKGKVSGNPTIGEITVTIDTSGSTMADQPMFLAEVDSLARIYNIPIRVLMWDAEVGDDITVSKSGWSRTHTRERIDKNETFEVAGGGGTKISSVNEYLVANNMKPKLLIYFTDGYVEASPKFFRHAGTKHVFFITPDGQGNQFSSIGDVVKVVEKF